MDTDEPRLLSRGRRRLLSGALAAAMLASRNAATVEATNWPSRPIRLVVPFGPGGPTDLYARLLAEHLAPTLGCPVVVENRPGATGTVGTAAVARAAPDGHVLLLGSNSSQAIAPLLLRSPGFDPVRDFAPIAVLLHYGFYLVTNARLPVRSVQELVAYGRARPGRLNFATLGQGSGTHLVAEMFCARAGIEAVHIPYAGLAAGLLAVTTGEAHFLFDSVGNAQPMVAEGRLRGIAVSGPRRSPAVPDVPTLAETGFDGFDAEIWFGLWAPARTPPAIVDRLNREVDAFLARPEVRARLAASGYEAAGGPPDAIPQRLRTETPWWKAAISKAGLTQE